MVGSQGGATPGQDEDDALRDVASSGAVEFARGATDGPPDAAAFLLGVLVHGDDTRAMLAHVETGSGRLVDLGRVNPNVEPPRVTAQGGHVLALVLDFAAGATVLRTVGVSRAAQMLTTRLGPEVRKTARDPSGADIAVLPSGQALLVWDRQDAHGRSEIVGLSLDARSLRETSSPRPLTPAGRPASEPRLVAGPQSYWLLWLEPQTSAPKSGTSDDAGVLFEPPSVLYAAELDAAGRPRSTPVAINQDQPAPVIFDARVLPSGRLLVAYRTAPADRPVDDQPTRLAAIDIGAAVPTRAPDEAGVPGPGAPTLLGSPAGDPTWLAVEDASGATALVRAFAETGAPGAAPVVGVQGMAIAGEPRRLLVAEPRGIGVELRIQSCALD